MLFEIFEAAIDDLGARMQANGNSRCRAGWLRVRVTEAVVEEPRWSMSRTCRRVRVGCAR
jgi:hypothetical protein